MDGNRTANERPLIRPETRKHLWIGFALVMGLSLLFDVFVSHRSRFVLDGTLGFGAIYAVEAVVILLGMAKVVGYVLGRSDDGHD